MAPATSFPDVFSQLGALIEAKTRFTAKDIQLIAETSRDQSFELAAIYRLSPTVKQSAINGFFRPAEGDRRCAGPLEAAQSEGRRRLQLAAQLLQQRLAVPQTPYDAIQSGVLLPHETRYWQRHDCADCGARGSVACATCRGRKTEVCWRCHGRLTTSCDAYGCMYGQTVCTTCQGTGQVLREMPYSVPVQIPSTTWNNGIEQTTYHIEYRTEYRPEQHPCSAWGCLNGKVHCSQCFGTGQIGCTTCLQTGELSCRTCAGRGELPCDSCEGSGSVGETAWIDVDVVTEYGLQLPDHADDDARAIIGKNTPHSVASISTSLSLSTVESVADQPTTLRANYSFVLRIACLDARCSGKNYRLIAYGNNLKWLTTDGMVEDLLREDMERLSSALARSSDDGYLACSIDSLAEPLRHVVTSELNAEIVEATLSGTLGNYSAVVSDEYVRRVTSSLLGALLQIYTRTAKNFSWQVALAASLAMLVSWAFSTMVLGAGCGVATLGAAVLVFRRKVQFILTQVLGDVSLARRAAAIASKSRQDSKVIVLMLLPGLLCLLLLGSLLPDRGLNSFAAFRMRFVRNSSNVDLTAIKTKITMTTLKHRHCYLPIDRT